MNVIQYDFLTFRLTRVTSLVELPTPPLRPACSLNRIRGHSEQGQRAALLTLNRVRGLLYSL